MSKTIDQIISNINKTRALLDRQYALLNQKVPFEVYYLEYYESDGIEKEYGKDLFKFIENGYYHLIDVGLTTVLQELMGYKHLNVFGTNYCLCGKIDVDKCCKTKKHITELTIKTDDNLKERNRNTEDGSGFKNEFFFVFILKNKPNPFKLNLY